MTTDAPRDAPAPAPVGSPGGADRGLPETARRRLVGAAQAWSSAQPVTQEAALRQLGLLPIGVVIGSANSWGVALAPRSLRGSRRAKVPPPPGGQWQPTSLDDPVTSRRHGGYVHDWRLSNDDPSSRHVGWTWELVMHERRELQLIDTVLSDLVAEARALGAHGVVGITLRRRRLGVERGSAYPVLELAASGTAVALAQSPPGTAPFTTGLPGTDLLKLARHGWAPVRYVVGIGHVRGVRRREPRRALVSGRNGEVHQLSELREKSLDIAVRSIEHRAPPESDIVVAVERTTDEEHLDVQTRLTGSAVRRLPDAVRDPLDYRKVVNLSR